MTPIIIDLEWNHPARGQKRYYDLPNEIIQIGAAKIDMQANVLDRFSITIKPVYYRKLNKEVADLTLLTNADLEKGVSFVEAVESFRSWCGEDFVFISWSPSDGIELSRNCRKFDYDTSWMPRAYDAQLMFDDMEMQENRVWPLNYALYHFQEKPDGAHNALADVLSTALILKHLDLEDGLTDDYFRCDGFYSSETEEQDEAPSGESDAEAAENESSADAAV